MAGTGSGSDDVAWANARLQELTGQRERHQGRLAAVSVPSEIPQLDVAGVAAYRENFRDLLAYGTNGEQRELVRCFVDSITLRPQDQLAEKTNEPVAHEITVNFKAMPARFVKGMGAGGGFEPPTFGL